MRSDVSLKNAPYSSHFIFDINGRVVKQDCEECSFTWGISKEVYETADGKREAHINRSMVICKCSTRHWNYYLETYTGPVPANSRQ